MENNWQNIIESLNLSITMIESFYLEYSARIFGAVHSSEGTSS